MGKIKRCLIRIAVVAAAGDFFNISRDITAQIVAGCCQSLAVQNLSTVPIEMVDASINFDREGVSVLGVM